MSDTEGTLAQCREVIGRLKPSWRSRDIDSVAFIDSGYSNRNYRFHYRNQSYVLRIARSRGRPLHINRSHEKQILSRGISSVTPELIAYDETTGDMISRFIPGILCADLTPEPREVAHYLVRLHRRLSDLQLPPHRLSEVISSNLARARHQGFVVPGWIQARLDLLEWQPSLPVNCHNDLNPWNIICPDSAPESWRTLDWEYAGGNDTLFDILSLSRGLGFDCEQEAELIQRIAPTTTAEDVSHALQAYLLREYSWAVLQSACGNQRQVILEQVQGSAAALKALGPL